VLGALGATLAAALPLVPADSRLSFERDIRPLLADNCVPCHGPAVSGGGLKFTDREAALAKTKSGLFAIVPGHPESSELLRRVTSSDPSVRMPMGKDPLKAEEIEKLRFWIAEGAAWDRHWAFQPLRPSSPPKVPSGAGARNDIDRFILATLAKQRIAPSPEADRITLIRRLSYDLVGLPPKIEEVDAFIRDTAPDAYERVVDRLLASPHFGERWGRHWLDLARYADSDGYEKDRARPDAYVYRDWVIEAINRDLPYDRFTIEQLAGDLLPGATASQKIATAFNRQTLTNEEGGVDQEEFRVAAAFDRTATLGTVWLGLTVGCARCHDHKYDPISQRDHYRLFAFFNAAEEVSDELPVAAADLPRLEAELAPLEKKLQARYSELLPGALEWQAAEHRRIMATASVPLAEHTAEVLAVETEGGAGSVRRADADIVVAAGPERDTYTVTARTDTEAITGFKLWVLPDAELPGKGPGRGRDGNFALTGFRVFVQAEGRPDEPVSLHRPQTDYAERGFAAADVVTDGAGKGGWAVGGKTGEKHWIQFRTREPLRVGTDKRLRIVLEQRLGDGRTIGRFRLAVLSGNERGLHIGRKEVADGLEAYPEKRVARTRRILLDYYVDTVVADAEVRALRKQVAELIKQHGARTMEIRAMGTPLLPRQTHILDRGDFLQPGAAVEPGVPSILPPLRARGPIADRLDLARWLVSPEHPLTARVAVNDVWKLLFGQGLIRTQDDLGVRGQEPSHPELLDWLAAKFRGELAWSRKSLIRLIVTSAAYRQTSRHRPDLEASDPDNRWLARQNRFRVESEVVRDLHLAASGLLAPKIGGPSVFPPMTEDLAKLSYADNFTWRNSEGEDRYRRGMYTFFKRTIPHPNLMTFDSPDANVACVARTASNTPLQALQLLNHESHLEAAQALACRVLGAASGDAARLTFAVRACVARVPASAELRALQGVLDAARRHYAAHPEDAERMVGRHAPSGVPLPEAAAWVAAVRIVLNYDEFITRE
jgi:hypothetical protein